MGRRTFVDHATVPEIRRSTGHGAYRGGTDVVPMLTGAVIGSVCWIAVGPSRRRGDRHDGKERKK